MAIAADIIFCWNGTHAGIPDGWERETSLDAKYPKGTALATDPNDTGGAATHNHTVIANHSHVMNAHTHTTTIGNHPTNGQPAGGSQTFAVASHTHNSGSIASGAASGGSLSSVASTYSAISNDPPYHEVIFIKPTDPVAGLADDGICFVDTSSTLGFTFCNGSNDTPDLRNKYLKGAAALGDAGGTGGSTTNVHIITHTHVVASHNHANVTTGASPTGNGSTSTSSDKLKSHTHTLSYASTTATTDGANVELTTIETVEPVYRKMLPVQNKTGNTLESVGMIGMWLGTLANIPTGWSEVPLMRGKHLKCANTTSEIGTTSGSNTHTHAAQNHTHTGVAHNHVASGGGHAGIEDGGDSGDGDSKSTKTASSHALTVANSTATYVNSSTTAVSSSNEPPYRTVVFIKLTNIISGGAFLFNMI